MQKLKNNTGHLKIEYTDVNLHEAFVHKNKTLRETKYFIKNLKEGFDDMWEDHRLSKPEKNKNIRDCSKSSLGPYLRAFNNNVLKGYDSHTPSFIYGGIQGGNHVEAASKLLENEGTLLKLDFKNFFESIDLIRVKIMFERSGCSSRAAAKLANIFCIAEGKKGCGSKNKVLARGFSTSTRIAIWCHIDTFYMIVRLIDKKLSKYKYSVIFFVDDIGIMTQGVPKNELLDLANDINTMLETKVSGNLCLNMSKVKIREKDEAREILGINILKGGLDISNKKLEELYDIEKNEGKGKGLRKYREYVKQYKNKIF